MFLLVRKNLASLILNQNSLVCKSHVSLSLCVHFFSSRREKQNVICPRLHDLLVHKHHFSHEVASLAASHLSQFRSPEIADSILSFLEESGFSSTQLEKFVLYKPRILSVSVENIEFKMKIFRDLGFSSEDIVRIFSSNQMVLHISANNKITPSICLLKSLLGPDYDLARLLRRSMWFLFADLERTLVPNVEFLKSCGVPYERIVFLIYAYPRCVLMKPDIIRKSVDKAKEMGFSESSNMFIYAFRTIASTSEGMWEVRMQALRDLGFSDSDILAMFKKVPSVLCISVEKVEKVTELLLATGKFNLPSIVSSPVSLLCSIENRFRPRLQILEILESKNLIAKWPSLSTICILSDDKFSERFIRPYSNEVDGAFLMKSYAMGKRR